MIKDFYFDNRYLSQMGYLILYDNVVDETSPVSTMDFATFKAAQSDISHKTSTNYPEDLTKVISIYKNPCEHENLNLTNIDISYLSRWLSRKQYKWFRWITDETDMEIWYQVQIKIDKIEYGDDILGLQLTIQANRPYGVSRPIESEYECQANSTNIIYVNTDEEGYTYPDMVIDILEPGDFQIINQREPKRIMKIDGCIIGEKLTITGSDVLQIETNKYPNRKRELADDFNYLFFRLSYKDGNGKNVFVPNLRCNIKMSYREIRKVGF